VNNLLRRVQMFLKDDGGATAIEYALIASILGIALLPVLSNTTSGVASLYTRVQGYFDIVNGG
jgi:Flp pilus assembly pilin Flp